jgi:hypothetical protein
MVEASIVVGEYLLGKTNNNRLHIFSRMENSWTSSGAMSGQVQHRRVRFGGGWERENRRSWREGEENESRSERRRHGENYLLSPKLSSLDYPELKGEKERTKPRERKQPEPQITKRRLPK